MSELDDIQRRANDPFGTSMQGVGRVDADRDFLLAHVAELNARLAAVLNLANTAGRTGWRISADELRRTLRGES